MEDVALDRLAERAREVDRVDGLEDVGTGAARECALDHRLVGRRREDHDLDLGMLTLDLLERGEPVDAWHPQVEEDELRLHPPHEGKDLTAVVRLGDYLEIVGVVESTLDALTDELVVVCDQ